MDGNFADLTLPDKVSIIDTVQTRIQNGQWSIQWNRRERISEIVNGVCSGKWQNRKSILVLFRTILKIWIRISKQRRLYMNGALPSVRSVICCYRACAENAGVMWS